MIVFKLKDPKSDKKETPIRMYCFFPNEKFYIYTKLKVLPDNWIPKTKRVKTSALTSKNGRQLNVELDRLEGIAINLGVAFKSANIVVTKEVFKEKFEEEAFNKLTKTINPKETLNLVQTFTQHWETHIQKMSDAKGYRNANPHRLALGMVKKCRKNKKELTFEDITYDFYLDFVEYMIMEKGYSINYTGTLIGRLNTFMSITFKKRLHKNIDYLQFKRMAEDVDNIALNDDQVEKLAKLKLTISYYDIARDIFLVQCYGGARFSDTIKFQKANIQGKDIRFIADKTGKLTVIPINKGMRKIIQKYNGGFPPPLSLEKVNEYIKEVAKFAKLNEEVIIRTNIKGKKVDTIYKTWEQVSSHTGRRTALTNMKRGNVDLNDILAISGHSSLKQLQIYLKIDNEEKAENMRKSSFFK